MAKSKIIPLSQTLPNINLLAYGDSGSGKTYLGGTDERVLFIAPEKAGLISAALSGSNAVSWPVHSWADVVEAYAYLRELAQKKGDLPFNWVVIDSLTDMQWLLYMNIIEKGVDANAKHDEDVMEWQEFLKYYNAFKKMVKYFNDLPVNCYYTSLAREETDTEGDDFLTPDIDGKGYKISQQVAAMMTSYGYYEVVATPVENGKKGEYREDRIWTFSNRKAIRGKDRTGLLKPYTKNRTLAEIRELIERKLKVAGSTK